MGIGALDDTGRAGVHVNRDGAHARRGNGCAAIRRALADSGNGEATVGLGFDGEATTKHRVGGNDAVLAVGKVDSIHQHRGVGAHSQTACYFAAIDGVRNQNRCWLLLSNGCF